jgi:hypothetical protein
VFGGAVPPTKPFALGRFYVNATGDCRESLLHAGHHDMVQTKGLESHSRSHNAMISNGYGGAARTRAWE